MEADGAEPAGIWQRDVQEVGLDVRSEETIRPNLEGAVVHKTTRLQVIWLHAAHCLFFVVTVFMITGSGANAATETFFPAALIYLRADVMTGRLNSSSVDC